MSGTQRISWQVGAAVVGGVPALVLVSLGQISALAGGAAILVWIVSAILGLIMAFSFAQLPRCFPGISGGIGVLGGYVHERKRPWLATATRWSYWLGWSPGLAVYSVVLANYGLAAFVPGASPVLSWLTSLVLILLTTAVNYRGISVGAAAQLALSAAMLAVLILFGMAPVASGQFALANLLPLSPPTGWASWHGLAAVAGALFLAGWTCYGAELAISLAAEYKRGAADAVRCLIVVAVVTFVTYAALPVVMTGAIGSAGVQQDPVRALLALMPAALAHVAPVVAFGAVMIALLLSINMIVMTSSRLLFQVARDEESFELLGRTNRHGVPGNALVFDAVSNCVLLTVCFVLSGGKSADVPVALLCTANVAYFVTIILALAGVAALEPETPGGRRPFCCTRPVLGAMIAINVLLLACAGFAWGWRNIVVGWTVFLLITAAASSMRKRRAAVPAAATS